MFVVVSPAKKLDMSPVEGVSATTPEFSAAAQELAGVARGLSVGDLQKLMHISENLAKLNAERFRDFGEMESKPAVYAFAGDTYQGFEASTLDEDALRWAQDHFGILSGLYGILRPLDAIEPYRLEMGSRLKTDHGKTLYDYWGDKIAKAINARAKAVGATTLVNCASQEYFGAVDLDTLKVPVITPVFMEDKPGGPKIVSFYAKRARGAMARHIMENRLTDPDDLREFDVGGYAYQPDLSEPGKPVFLRSAEAAANAA
ncbi:peroxide stress protein YaaA [Lutimaribacter sp. EGI FJ00015]|uniref:Peroxide stress protein YaaA n=1 Tax=Lutimaribacter degradans TaxID=2945989 RepID=A0ACC5ZXM3_9RHOB|nr:peroxide stress protein YaaA [Lutimaribacter sp. EGI FJ00013]MCM2562580.1 peroxide stress protein YaaA [Lutimaribacter sp. EGI FJ00013]MCO0613737.1 peroxide stress protein YaaA [Lutimaribacter sp. EGI FJ00015]MCO0636780.1 peroxide stress protein YaaA [Lutimaribacter sp. EGI FJ00014]